MKSRISGIHIAGVAIALPPDIVKVDTFSDVLGEGKVRRLKRSTGVEQMHIVAPGVTAADLCVEAAERLFETLAIKRDEIDALVFVSISPDYRAPSTACILQDRLHLSQEAAAFDLTYACSGFPYGLFVASLLVQSGCRKVLLLNGDTQSTLVNPKDFTMRVLVGDAGAATIVEKGEETSCFYLKTVGSGYKNLIIPAGGCRKPCSSLTKNEVKDQLGSIRSDEDLYMNGTEVMKFSLNEVPRAIQIVCNDMEWQKNDVNLFAFHQPNKLILDYLSNMMDISENKMPVGLQRTGNTGSASIPVLLHTLKERGTNFTKMKHVIACGFGIGLAVGAVSLDLSQTIIM